jgi:hypothetical protein
MTQRDETLRAADETLARLKRGMEPVAESRNERFRRESTEQEAEWATERERRAAELATERERLSMAHQLHESAIRCSADVAASMKAINAFAERIIQRMDDMSSEIDSLRTRLAISDARFEDLKRSVDARPPTSTAEVLELPNPLAKRRA